MEEGKFRLYIEDPKNLFAYYFSTNDFQEYERKIQELEKMFAGKGYVFRMGRDNTGSYADALDSKIV